MYKTYIHYVDALWFPSYYNQDLTVFTTCGPSFPVNFGLCVSQLSRLLLLTIKYKFIPS